jgi:acetyl-CoA carboxylase carboxyl transferase subunit alpha
MVDGIIPEPIGGAHRDGLEVVRATGNTILKALAEFDALTRQEIRQDRRDKFLSMGRLR